MKKTMMKKGVGGERPGTGAGGGVEGWRSMPINLITRHHSGNSKLIKGKLHGEPSEGLFPAFSASGQDVWHSEYEREGEAIIVSAVGARCGKCFIARGKWSAIANTHVVWPDLEKVELKYLWYLLNDENFWVRSGSAQPFVATKKTFEKEIPLPPLATQKSIVAEIEKQFTRLDAGVAALKRVQANLKRYRAAVLKAACEGKLVVTEAELARKEKRKFESGEVLLGRILLERKMKWAGKGKYKEAVGPETAALAPLPEGWAWATMEQVTMVGPQNGLYMPQTAYGSGSPIIRIDDYQDYWSRENSDFRRVQISQKDTELYSLKDGDILINRVNSMSHIGKMMLIESTHLPAIFESNMMRIRTHHQATPQYVACYLKSKKGRMLLIQNAKQAVNQASINQSDVGQTVIPLPPLAEQLRIIAEVERRLSVVDELSAVVESNLQRAARLRQAVLMKAFATMPPPAPSPVSRP